MKKLILTIVTIMLSVGAFSSPVHAADQNIITPVFPIRGRDYWRQGKDLTHLTDIIKIVEKNRQPSTWLVQYDALDDGQVVEAIKDIRTPHEVGIFLEITRRLAEDSFVVYDWDWGHWSAANKLFLSGYEVKERQRMIDHVFESFKKTFGYYPKSYGAWYVDVWSSAYIKKHYQADIQLGLADQYATDGYQVWGQYVDQPYFMSRYSAVEPAVDGSDTGILKVLWAPREPTLSYGSSGFFSNYSVQVNDYHQSKGLGINYFIALINTLTTNIDAPLSQAVIGIEVSEVPPQFLSELDRQLAYVSRTPSLQSLTLDNFNQLYRRTYQGSPPLLVRSSHQGISSWWYMSPYYRLGLFFDGRIKINDLRFYQRTDIRDNDQSQVDIYNNLHRVVPAVIDSLSLDNAIDLTETTPPKVIRLPGETQLSWVDKKIRLQSDKIIIEGFNPTLFMSIPKDVYKTSGSAIELYPQSPPLSLSGIPCTSELGVYSPPLPCFKNFLSTVLGYVPDLRLSKLEGDFIFGLRTGPETLYGVRLPHLKLGWFTFQFPTLDHFLNIDNLRRPSWSWVGRQELEAKPYIDKGTLVKKTENYGQEEFLKDIQGKKLFENGYYIIYPR